MVAPVSRSIRILWLLTNVVIKIKDKFDGFKLRFPRAAPSFDVLGFKNGYRQMPDAPPVDIVNKFQVLKKEQEDQVTMEYCS